MAHNKFKAVMNPEFKQVHQLMTPSWPLHSSAHLQDAGPLRFQTRALQEGVHAMIQILEKNLIATRQPKTRAVKLVEGFLEHPDVQKAISEIPKQKFGWGLKKQLIMATALDHTQQIVQEHKLKRNPVSLAVMQVTLNDNVAWIHRVTLS
jgi:hypothetical protein